jgi:ribosome-associated translation inhibitor RaiA
MEIPPEIAYRNVEPSEVIEEKVKAGIARLEEVYPRIISCRVMVEVPNPRHQKGNLYRVRLDVTVPGKEIVISRHPPEHRSNEEVGQAIGEAFDLARRRLRKYSERRRGEVKNSEAAPQGRVLHIFHGEGYGFLLSPDGRQIYFHENSVLKGGFGGLDVGSVVRFVEASGEEGPQASAVVPL